MTYRAGVVEGECLAHIVDESLHDDHLQHQRHHQRDGLIESHCIMENQQVEVQTNVNINIEEQIRA
jgi:hypothetical protein